MWIFFGMTHLGKVLGITNADYITQKTQNFQFL
jgi:hypothetical protein